VLEGRSPDNNREIVGPPRRACDLEGAAVPPAERPSYHLPLFESYIQRCQSGVGRQGTVVSSPHEFTVDDKYAFRMLSSFVSGDIASTLDFHGIRAERLGITKRFLHHRVVRDPAYDEHHVFVELRDKDLRPVVATRGCLDIFSAGPIAHHYILSDRCSVSEYRLVSPPAFVEATTELYRSQVISPFRTWAYSWLLEGFRGATHSELSPDADWDQEIRLVRSVDQGMQSFTRLATPEEPQFVVDYDGQRYRMALWLDARLNVPVCFRGPSQII
jgi:hypothetical protein